MRKPLPTYLPGKKRPQIVNKPEPRLLMQWELEEGYAIDSTVRFDVAETAFTVTVENLRGTIVEKGSNDIGPFLVVRLIDGLPFDDVGTFHFLCQFYDEEKCRLLGWSMNYNSYKQSV